MLIIGADYHQGFRQTAFGDSETGEWRPLFAPLNSEPAVRLCGKRVRSRNPDASEGSNLLILYS